MTNFNLCTLEANLRARFSAIRIPGNEQISTIEINANSLDDILREKLLVANETYMRQLSHASDKYAEL